jgi:hypothetical protein
MPIGIPVHIVYLIMKYLTLLPPLPDVSFVLGEARYCYLDKKEERKKIKDTTK